MKLVQFFEGIGSAIAGAAAVVLEDVSKVFTTAKTAVAAAPLPANLKTDLTQTLNDAQADVEAAAHLAGGLFGQATGDGIADVTTLFYKTAGVVSSGKSLEDMSKAELTVLAQIWQTMQAQGSTLLAQAMVGIDPVAQQIAKQPAPQS